MMLGDYSDWRGWEYRDPWVAGLWHNPKKFAIPPWNGRDRGKLYVFGEQGLGDEAFFSSCLLDAMRLCEVTVETDERLIPVFTRLGVECVPAELVEVNGRRGRKQKEPEGDFWIPMGDLPRIFRTRPPFPNGPYLEADPEQVKRFEGYRGRVGVSWRGAQGEYSWSEFAGLAENPLSLQYDNDWDSEIEVPELDIKNDLEGVLGLLMNLSRVITVSTTVAHFSCALGVPTTVILAPPNGRNANRIPWKWGLNRKNVWYGSAEVYQSLREYQNTH